MKSIIYVNYIIPPMRVSWRIVYRNRTPEIDIIFCSYLFINNINIWYDEYIKGNLDAIISNTSGCGTTLKEDMTSFLRIVKKKN